MFTTEENARLQGLHNLRPTVGLLGESPSTIQETIHCRDLDGAAYYCKWSMGVGNAYNWASGGGYAYMMPKGVGYYAFDKSQYDWQSLGQTWEDASARLIRLKRAISVDSQIVKELVAGALAKADVERKRKVRPNRTRVYPG